MQRPTLLLKNTTLTWVMRIYNSSDALVDADSTPTVAVRKNGASTGDSVTVTKRSATTGIYDCSYNPASEVEGDQFTIEETAVVSGTTNSWNWSFIVLDSDVTGKVLGGGSGTISGVGARVVDGDGEAIVGGATAAQVWANANRTLTMTAAEIEAAVAGTDITIQRGDLVTIALTGLGTLTSRTGEKLRFTVKSDANQPDTAALVQATETTGAIYVAGSAASAANLASIAVTDASTGAVTISLTPTLTAALPTLARKAGVWDIQLEAGTGVVETLATGKVTIVADVSRAVP